MRENISYRVVLFWILIYLSALAVSSYAQADSIGKSRFIIISCPDSAVISADGKVIHHDIGGWYEVSTGDVKIEIRNRRLSYDVKHNEFPERCRQQNNNRLPDQLRKAPGLILSLLERCFLSMASNTGQLHL